MRARGRRGFTLVELIVALSLSTFVMIAIVSISASMVRFQFESMRKGNVTGLTLYGLDQLQTDLENASHLESPKGATPQGNVLSGCNNWAVENSPGISRQIDPSKGVVSFYYCLTAFNDPSFPNSLLRYQGNACPAVGPASCGLGAAGMTMDVVVYNNFYHGDNYPSYWVKRSTFSDGVELHFIIGVATPSPNIPIPVAYKFDTFIGMDKAYLNGGD